MTSTEALSEDDGDVSCALIERKSMSVIPNFVSALVNGQCIILYNIGGPEFRKKRL